MSAGGKDFDLEYSTLPPGPDYYSNWSRIQSTVAEAFNKDTATAPDALETARGIIAAVEKDKSPPKIWLGAKPMVFRFVLPYLPVAIADVIWAKVMRTDLINKLRS
jgi:hypothetical protein